jgi:hypothetical protein
MRINDKPIYSIDGNVPEGKDVSMNLLRAQDFYEHTLGWNFDTVWQMCPNYPYPVFQWQNCDSLPLVGINVLPIAKNINIYPNPANDKITIEFDLTNNNKVTIKLCNILGQEILNMYDGTLYSEHFHQEFSLQRISEGSYFIKITIDNKTKYEKIIVKKVS